MNGMVDCQENRPTNTPELASVHTEDIRITKVLNGYVIKIGCQTVVFNDKSVMIAELSRFYDNPQAVKDEYLKKYQ